MNTSPASLSLQLAAFRSQTLSSMMSPTFGAKSDDTWASLFALLTSKNTQFEQLSPDPLSLLTNSSNTNLSSGAVAGSAAGRNMMLSDPESAYRMMSFINSEEVSYKARFSELSQMGSYVSQMQVSGQSLVGIESSTGNDGIRSRLQDFVAQYNSWIQRFDADMQKGGLLSDNQAARISQYEMEQSIKNRFHGIKDGLHGMSDLGITIDPATRLASLDVSKLDSVLATNKLGVVDTVHEFSANFTQTASLLNSEGNFISNQLDNLDRAIHYISGNKTSLQKEFGHGNSARPTAQVAQALAAYNQTFQN